MYNIFYPAHNYIPYSIPKAENSKSPPNTIIVAIIFSVMTL